ncbi:MFS transporter [Brevibacillus migulae]|uniref:MFS transporter n=1 Tax=Brevibacillus migulae TaxID=1644114 RepID=UPI0014315AF7|nr:MFS transporter [Brevibacillus migulae]
MLTGATPAAAPTSLWKSRTFAIMLASSLLLSIGNKIYEIVLPLMMYELTHSSVSMASMRTAELLPNLLFAAMIGVIVDRVNKKKWVLGMIGSQALLLFLLVYLFKSGNETLLLYYLLGFLLMTFNYGYFNAQVSLIKLTVPSHHLTAANANLTFTETLVSVMGPALTGLVFLLANLSDGILITAVAYLLCFVLFSRLRIQEIPRQDRKLRFWKELQDGWVAFTANRLLVMISVFVIFLNCSMTVVSTAVIFFAKDDLQLSSSLLAIVLSISGIGGLVGSMAAGWLRKRVGLGLMFGIGAIANALGYLGLYVCEGLIVLILSLFVIGFAISMHTISVYTFRHEQTPAELMGRSGGITGTLFRLGMPLTMYVSGWMILWWGTSSIFLSAAVWNGIAFLLLLRTKIIRIA